jgi:hypothetical protein
MAYHSGRQSAWAERRQGRCQLHRKTRDKANGTAQDALKLTNTTAKSEGNCCILRFRLPVLHSKQCRGVEEAANPSRSRLACALRGWYDVKPTMIDKLFALACALVAKVQCQMSKTNTTQNILGLPVRSLPLRAALSAGIGRALHVWC